MYYSIFKKIKHIYDLLFWYFHKYSPRNKNYWIFGTDSGKKYIGNSKALFEYMIRYHPEYSCTWITKDENVYNHLNRNNLPVVMYNSKKCKTISLKAKIAIISHGTGDLNPIFLNGITEIWVWHGVPIKKFAWDDNKTKNHDFRNTIKLLFNPWNRIFPSFTITSGDFFIPFLQSAFKIDENKIIKTGLPRCDYFYSDNTENIILNLKKTHPSCKIIMYMPTFRNSTYTGIPFNPFSSFGFDSNNFQEVLVNKNYVFLYKPHINDSNIKINMNISNFYQISDNDYIELYCLLKDIDILMTDYSSIYFDFIITKKSIILAPFDYEYYIKESREHYFSYYKNIEGIKAKNWDEVISILNNELYSPVSNETIFKYSTFNDGRSSEKLFSFIENNII